MTNQSARLAQRNNWVAGTTIQGTGNGTTKTVKLTYVSDQLVVGIDTTTGEEKTWNLTGRSWEQVREW